MVLTVTVMKIAYARVRMIMTGIKTQKKPTNMGKAFVMKNGTKTTHINTLETIVAYNNKSLRYFCTFLPDPVPEEELPTLSVSKG
jgi:hypothetical protein